MIHVRKILLLSCLAALGSAGAVFLGTREYCSIQQPPPCPTGMLAARLKLPATSDDYVSVAYSPLDAATNGQIADFHVTSASYVVAMIAVRCGETESLFWVPSVKHYSESPFTYSCAGTAGQEITGSLFCLALVPTATVAAVTYDTLLTYAWTLTTTKNTPDVVVLQPPYGTLDVTYTVSAVPVLTYSKFDIHVKVSLTGQTDTAGMSLGESYVLIMHPHTDLPVQLLFPAGTVIPAAGVTETYIFDLYDVTEGEALPVPATFFDQVVVTVMVKMDTCFVDPVLLGGSGAAYSYPPNQLYLNYDCDVDISPCVEVPLPPARSCTVIRQTGVTADTIATVPCLDVYLMEVDCSNCALSTTNPVGNYLGTACPAVAQDFTLTKTYSAFAANYCVKAVGYNDDPLFNGDLNDPTNPGTYYGASNCVQQGVLVPPPGPGCTYTIGYWKTHACTSLPGKDVLSVLLAGHGHPVKLVLGSIEGYRGVIPASVVIPVTSPPSYTIWESSATCGISNLLGFMTPCENNPLGRLMAQLGGAELNAYVEWLFRGAKPELPPAVICAFRVGHAVVAATTCATWEADRNNRITVSDCVSNMKLQNAAIYAQQILDNWNNGYCGTDPANVLCGGKVGDVFQPHCYESVDITPPSSQVR